MAKGYWVVNLDVVNPVSFLTYAEANVAFGVKHKVHFVIGGGDFEQMEGIKRHRNALVEIPSYEEALSLHASSEFAVVSRLRQDSCVADIAAVEGYDGPQPSAAPPPAGSADFPRGYWMARIDITDPVLYQDYAAATQQALAAFDGWYVVRGGRCQILEGKGRDRYVVVAFRDVVTARACYFSPSYERARAIRQKAAESDFLIISGYTGREPHPA